MLQGVAGMSETGKGKCACYLLFQGLRPDTLLEGEGSITQTLELQSAPCMTGPGLTAQEATPSGEPDRMAQPRQNVPWLSQSSRARALPA